MIRSVFFLLFVCSSATADIVFLNVGDSVSANNQHRVTLQSELDSQGVEYDFVVVLALSCCCRKRS